LCPTIYDECLACEEKIKENEKNLTKKKHLVNKQKKTTTTEQEKKF